MECYEFQTDKMPRKSFATGKLMGYIKVMRDGEWKRPLPADELGELSEL